MITFEGLEENFTFLVAEVESQVRATISFLERPTTALRDRIVGRDDYIDNLHTVVENTAYAAFYENDRSRLDKTLANRVRAVQVVNGNLERIADFCENIVQQTAHLSDQAFLRAYDSSEMFREITTGLARILPAFRSNAMGEALAICRAEPALDRQYKARFDRILAELGAGENVQNLITVLFIFRYLERIGDSLLNIGEALLFAILGERIKIEQFQALEETLSGTGFTGGMAGVDFQAIWGTRSGCRIGRIGRAGAAGSFAGGIYKEGAIRKIAAEKSALERWDALYPGLTAQVLGYREDEGKASMLVQYLPGGNLDEIVLAASPEVATAALRALAQTVRDIWAGTKKPQPVSANFMGQLLSRLDMVLQIHPDFIRRRGAVCGRAYAATDELIRACSERERELRAPFSVLIHGDFNVNNLVYDPQTARLHYLDVHRSRDMDYAQDASVFLVSNFRMPVFEPRLRERINRVIAEFSSFVATFAAENGDARFPARMALALARSLYTSSRFELNRVFSREMFLRAHFLLEKVAAHSGPWEDFVLPERILFT